MKDRTPPQPFTSLGSQPSASGDGANEPVDPFGLPDAPPVVHDAVFEEIEIAPAAAPQPAWDSVEIEDPFVEPAPPQAPATPFEAAPVSPAHAASAAGAWQAPEAAPTGEAPVADGPRFDERGGFRIDAEAPTTTALAPIERSLPARPQPATPPPPPVEPPRTQTRRAFRDRLQMLRRHKWLILGLFLLSLGLSALYAYYAPRVYSAYSILMVGDDRMGGAATDVIRDMGATPGTEGRRVLNQALVLQQNPEIAQNTAQALLDQRGATALSVVDKVEDEYGSPVTVEALADFLQAKVVSVTPANEQADAIRVQAKTRDPREAALIAGLFTDEYLSLSRTANRADLSETRELLEEQVAAKEGELVEIESQLAGFLTSQNAAGLEAQTASTVSQIGQLESQLDLARVEVQQRQATLAQLEQEAASIQPRLAETGSATASAELEQINARITEMEVLLNQALRQNPDLNGDPNAHPDTRAIAGRIASLRADAQRLSQQQASGVVAGGGLDMSSPGANGPAYVAELQRRIADERSALQGARARVGALGSRLGAARGDLRAKPGQEVTRDRLERRRFAAAEALQNLQRRLDQTRVAEGTELAVARVIRPVQIPRRPSSPNVPLILGLGAALGLLLGLGAALARYQTDSRAHTPGDVETAGFTVVGNVPDLTDALREGRQTVDGVAMHPGLVTVTRAFSAEAEAFRHLHAALQSGAGSSQVALVTGADDGVGKSLVAANVAAAGAQAGRRVLLVDADLRTPAVGALLGLGESPALGEGGPDLNAVYWSTAVPGLFALTARETPDAPGEAWAPDRVGRLLDGLRGTFDLVVVDAPAALRTADAALLAPYADAALLVAEAGRTDVEALQQVATELSGAGLQRLGVVLNRFDPKKAVGYRRTAGARFDGREAA